MKVAHICPYDIDRPGGVQIHIRDTATALAEAGHEVVIVAPKVAHSTKRTVLWSQIPGVTIVRVGATRKIKFGATGYELSIARGRDLYALNRLIREGGFDVIHYHTMWTPLLPYQVFTRSPAANVATFHDTTARTPTGMLLRAIFRALSRRLLPRLDAVIAVSEAPLQHLRPARDQKVHIVAPCTNLRRFAAEPRAPRRFNDGRVNILFLGRLEKRKGVLLLLHAYRRLCSEGLPVRLIIAGNGPDHTAIRRFVRRKGILHVEFSGEFPMVETPNWYAESDIVCAPSPSGESFGIVIAEAMASGKPVVAAANAGYRTLLTGEAAQLLAIPGNVASLFEKLRSVVLDASLRERLGQWGRKEAMRYDCRAVVPKLETIYKDAIPKAHARTPKRRKRRFVGEDRPAW
jgi:phosphatidylinositol alpha-mannosyltransferase